MWRVETDVSDAETDLMPLTTTATESDGSTTESLSSEEEIVETEDEYYSATTTDAASHGEGECVETKEVICNDPDYSEKELFKIGDNQILLG